MSETEPTTNALMMSDLYELVRRSFPGASDEEASAVLWNCTAFPFVSSADALLAAITKAKENGGTIEGAIDWSHKVLDESMAEYRRSQDESQSPTS